jgi:2,4-dienoyl-CoA reductase (NADPH2)
VVATGGRLVVPDVPGRDRRGVFSGPSLRRMLAGGPARPLSRFARPHRLRALSRLWMPLGRRVVVVGADLAALELAEFLASRGRRVSVLEPGDQLAPEVGLKRLTEHMDRLDGLGVAVNTGVAVLRIESDGVVIADGAGGARHIPADSVVMAGHLEADTAFFDAVKGLVPEAHAVGDCTGLGLVRKATEEATRVAAAL